jgi:arylformamidase
MDEPVVHDISMVLRPGAPEWPGDKPYSCGWTQRMDEGANLNLGHFAMSPHVGSHADAPLHVLADGAPSGDFPLAIFRGPAYVLDLPGHVRELADPLRARVGFEHLEPLLPGQVERLLLRSDASTADGIFPEQWPTLTPECMAALCDRGLRLLGVDAPSIDARHAKALDSHRALFGRGAYNLENLDLRGVATGWYELVAYPLRLAGMDGSPVRAVLGRAARA